MAQILKNIQLVTEQAPERAPNTSSQPKAPTPTVEEMELHAQTIAPVIPPTPSPLQQTELDAAKKAAREEGFKIGYEEGLSASQAKLALQTSRLDQQLNELNKKSQQPFADQETALIEIAVTAIARLTGEKLSDREQALNIIRQALDEYGDQHVSTVYLHSDDYDFWLQAGIQLERFSNLKIVASPKVSVGGCLIETTNGFIDARVETQIERIRSILLHARNGGVTRAH